MKKVLATILALVMALSVTTMAWADDVAKIGNTGYATLQEAVNAATAGQTIVLQDNVTLTASLNVAVDKTVTLDLNSCKITADMNGPHMICNAGNLTITDSSENKTGEIAKIGAETNFGYVIENHGTMTLDRCKISSTSVKSSAIENGWYTASENTAGTSCIMTIQNAEVVSVNAAGGLYTVKNDDYGVMVINGGVFTNGVAGAGAVLNWNDLTINGGTFTGASAVRTLKSGSSDFEIGKSQIKNGTFNGIIDTLDNYNTGITIAVTGGTFSSDVRAYTADNTPVASNERTNERTTYYVGAETIQNVASNLSAGQRLVIRKGTVRLTGVPAGVIVRPEQDTVVFVNGKDISNEFDGYTVPQSSGYYYYQPTTDTKTTDTKGSPKTFDAGIALYVGMALTSAAGVAFVGKKRED
jgi:hypothetical protein